MTATIYTFPTPPPPAQPEPAQPELAPPDLGDEAFDLLAGLIYRIAMRDVLGLDTTLEIKLAAEEARRLRRELGGPGL